MSTIVSLLHPGRCQVTAGLNPPPPLVLRDRSRISRKNPPKDRFQFSIRNDPVIVRADRRRMGQSKLLAGQVTVRKSTKGN